MHSDKLELLAYSVGDLGDLFVRNPELGITARRDLLVVAGADPRVNTDGDPAVVAALGESIEGICRADRDRQPRCVVGEVNSVVKVVIRWVNRRILKRVRVSTGID